jgi:hypothetical protein
VTLRAWSPTNAATDQFAGLALGPNESDEMGYFLKASPGSKLNLSAAEIGQLKKLNGNGDANPVLRDLFKARYEAYRQAGLKGIAPYTRSGSDGASPGKELTQALQQALPGKFMPAYRAAMLDYPANPLPEMQHRFLWYKKPVEDRPTIILAHRTSYQAQNLVVLTEEQFYVSHSYNCNFFICAGFAVEGGTLLFYQNRTFTDQVAGFGSSLKHSIGRKQMLSALADNLKDLRAH